MHSPTRNNSANSYKEYIPGYVRRFFKYSIPFSVVIGLVPIFLFAFKEGSLNRDILAVGFILSLSSFMIGDVLGFLFGIPRTLQRENGSAEDTTTQTRTTGNTNLESISDWLTKVLIGAGLTQIGQIGTTLQHIGQYASAAFPNIIGADIFFIGIIIYYSLGGFLTGCLLTRFIFEEVDRVRLQRKVREMKE